MFPIIGFSQINISWNDDPGISYNGDTIFVAGSNFDVIMYCKNTSGSTLDIKFSRLIISNSVPFFDQFTDNNWAYSVSSNPWTTPISTTLQSGDSSLMKPHYFFQNPGSAHLRYYVLDLNNVKLDSVDVNISPCTETYSTFNDSTCNSYSWNGSTYNVSGAYSYSSTNSNGCDSIATLNLIVNSDSFDLDFSVDNQGFTSPPFIPFFTNLSANMQLFDYTWDWGDGTQTQSNNVNVFHEYLYNGLFDVKLIAERISTGCIDTLSEQDYIFTSGGSGLSIIKKNKSVNIYPNPTNENITISIINYNGKIQTEVYDFIGNKLQISNETTINLSDYARGIYIVKVAYGDRVEEVKVIKD